MMLLTFLTALKTVLTLKRGFHKRERILFHSQNCPCSQCLLYSVYFAATSTAWKVPLFRVFMFVISQHSDWTRRDTPYLFVFSPNAGKYVPEQFRIRYFLCSVDVYPRVECFDIDTKIYLDNSPLFHDRWYQ